MVFESRLHDEPFKLIKLGSKTIELRVYDEKKARNAGDYLYFTNRVTREKIKTKIVVLHIYKSFDELYHDYDKVSLGYRIDEAADPKDMEVYYPRDEQEKYGVVGIEIELL